MYETLFKRFGREVAVGFGKECSSLLMEARERPIRIRPEERDRMAAAGLLLKCEFLLKVEEGVFVITEAGCTAYELMARA